MKYFPYILLVTSLLSCTESTLNDTPDDVPVIDETLAVLTEAQIQNAEIQTALPQQREVAIVLKLNGKIEVPPQNMVSISVPLGGYLKSTQLLPGTYVRRGQTLAVMEDPQYIRLQQEYLAGQARLAYLETDYNRQKELSETQSSPARQFQQAEADYRSQQVALRALAEQLRLVGLNPDQLSPDRLSRSVSVPSPISGYVTRVNVNIGKYVSPTDVLFELVNPSDIHLALKVFEKDLGQLRIGQQLWAYSNAQPDRRYPCRIILISRDISAERTAEIHCHFEKYDPDLLPGMYMNAELALDAHTATVLPEDAIVSYENKEYIFIPQGKGQFRMTEVATGETENGYTEVIGTQDLTRQPCVVKGAYSLLMSLKNTSEE